LRRATINRDALDVATAPERLLPAHGAKIVGLTDTSCGIAQCASALFRRAAGAGGEMEILSETKAEDSGWYRSSAELRHEDQHKTPGLADNNDERATVAKPD
jgi:hypothetical protein